MDWLLDLLGLNKGKATINAADQNRGIIGGLNTDLNRIIDTTDASQRGTLNQALGSVDLGAGGQGILRDVLGLGGADGSARAMSAFHGANPGYQFQMDQGLDALDRRAASRGMLSSGNTNLDTLNYSQGLADQSFGDWFDRLMGGIDRQSSALGDLTTQAGQVGATRMGTTADIGALGMAANNQTAAGKEAGQGGIWDLLDNISGVAGSFFGMGGVPSGGYGKGPSISGTTGGQKLGYGGGF